MCDCVISLTWRCMLSVSAMALDLVPAIRSMSTLNKDDICTKIGIFYGMGDCKNGNGI